MSEKIWQEALLKEDATIQDAILSLNNSSLQIALVVSAKNNLIGTITDGDIRRGILSGLNINSSVKTIINIDPLVAKPNMSRILWIFHERLKCLTSIF